MKRSVKITLRILAAITVLVAVGLIALYCYSVNYQVPPAKTGIENITGLVQAQGRFLYDPLGQPLQLRGINAGQILLQEGWMSPFALEPLRHEDGSYVKDADGNLQYPEFSEEEFRAGLARNPNLADCDTEALMHYYWECCFSPEDFRIVRQELGMNVIRLPFYYLNILHEDLTVRQDAFAYLDWFVSQAAEQELYVILDLHGAPGSQNGYEHSGSAARQANLWQNPELVDATVRIWDTISKHYTQDEPQLGKWIASYDLLNEPTITYKGRTNRDCWEVMDRIYDTIRQNGDLHVITMGGCWEFSSLPDPQDYGWENVQYEYHWYNWKPELVPYRLFFMYQDLFNLGRDYEVPVLIGEFTCFEDRDTWQTELTMFDRRSYNWTVWNYKTAVTGWWTSSWGVYTCQLQLDTAAEQTKCNIESCTLEEFLATCDKMRTENCATGTLYEVMRKHLSA